MQSANSISASQPRPPLLSTSTSASAEAPSGSQKASTSASTSASSSSSATNNPGGVPKKIYTIPTATVQSIGVATKQYTHEFNRAYSELEKNMMKRINESNQRRFRLGLASTVALLIWVSVVFGTRLRKILTDQTAGLAKETLENESLKVQTQELAMAVVQTVLNDKEVTAHAAAFLKEGKTNCFTYNLESACRLRDYFGGGIISVTIPGTYFIFPLFIFASTTYYLLFITALFIPLVTI
jgi:hypothetical protein